MFLGVVVGMLHSSHHVRASETVWMATPENKTTKQQCGSKGYMIVFIPCNKCLSHGDTCVVFFRLFHVSVLLSV